MDAWKRNEKKELRPCTCGLEKRDSRTLAVKKVESTESEVESRLRKEGDSFVL